MVDKNELVTAFSIFDPKNFPDLTVIEQQKGKEAVENFGKKEMQVLTKFYGTPKIKTDFQTGDEVKVDPVIDSSLAVSQFPIWKVHMRNWILKQNVSTFRQLVRKATARAN